MGEERWPEYDAIYTVIRKYPPHGPTDVERTRCNARVWRAYEAAVPEVEKRVREQLCREFWAYRDQVIRLGARDNEKVDEAARVLFQACRRIDDDTTRRLRNEAARDETV